jgi:hypothetical protein
MYHTIKYNIHLLYTSSTHVSGVVNFWALSHLMTTPSSIWVAVNDKVELTITSIPGGDVRIAVYTTPLELVSLAILCSAWPVTIKVTFLGVVHRKMLLYGIVIGSTVLLARHDRVTSSPGVQYPSLLEGLLQPVVMVMTPWL